MGLNLDQLWHSIDTDIAKSEDYQRVLEWDAYKIRQAEQDLRRGSFVLQQDKRTNRASNVGGETIDCFKQESNAFQLNVQEYGQSAKEAWRKMPAEREKKLVAKYKKHVGN